MKLLIADDEKWVRLTIKKLVPCERLGLTISAEASDGLEALELCKQHKPSIVITDIRMPGLSGLDLIKELKQILPATRIIIISGYNDFEYAKTAMKYGVTDYLLKPVDENELCQAIQKLKDSIISETNELEAQTKLIDNYKNALPLVLEEFLNQLVLPNQLTTNTINSTLGKYGIPIENDSYTLIVFSPDLPSEVDKKDHFKYYKLLIKRVMLRIPGTITFSSSSSAAETIVFINHSSKVTSCSFERAIALCLKIFKKHYNSTISAGISEATNQINKLPALYIQANEALEARFWEGKERINYYNKNLFTNNLNVSIPSEVIDKMLLSLTFSNFDPILEFVDETFDSLSHKPYIKTLIIKDYFWTLILSLTSKFDIYLPYIESISNRVEEHPYEVLRNTLTSDDFRICLKNILRSIAKHIPDKSRNDTKKLVENVKRLIDLNYSKDISLEFAAKQVHLSQTYLSEMFKKVEGISFIDYKNSLRIEEAKNMLCFSNLSINEICTKLGYSDSKYFVKQFKRSTGFTLSEFRERAKK